MINELYKLGEALSSASIQTKPWRLKELKKVSADTLCFKIMFSDNLAVHSIEELTDNELVSKFRKYEPSNGNSFPAFNMPNLFSFSKENTRQVKEWMSGKGRFDYALLKSWCTEEANAWDNNTIIKVSKCISDVPKELNDKIANIHKNNPVTQLVNLLAKIGIENFRKALEFYIFGKLEKNEDVTQLLNFLVSPKTFNPSKSQNNSGMQIILDLYEWEPFGKPVANEDTIEWLNSVLIECDKVDYASGETRDAFGHNYMDVNEKMPEIKLAVGDVRLRSMFKDHRCQFRYKNLIEDKSFPISKVNRDKVEGAINWLKETDKEGKTWGKIDDYEVLFAYPSVIPPRPLEMATLLGASKRAKVENTVKFESIAENIIQTLKGLSIDKSVAEIQIFAIRKVDDISTKAKIVYFRNHSVDHLVKSAQVWEIGCKNIPLFSFRMWTWAQKNNDGTKTKPEAINPEVPKPLQIAKIINKAWKIDGDVAGVAGELKRVKYYQGLELLLEHDKYELSKYLLNVLVSNSFALIVYLGNIYHSGKVVQEKEVSCENMQLLFPIFGMLLYSQNRTKEEYMENLPYLIGQILKISDELHTLYCKVVRDGNIPPQLAGNSLMVSALEAPERMLAQLAQRINPYLAWAKQYRTKECEIQGKESWRAGWYLGLYERNAVMIKVEFDKSKDIRFGDREKAELFIGYLAAFPKKEDTTSL